MQFWGIDDGLKGLFCGNRSEQQKNVLTAAVRQEQTSREQQTNDSQTDARHSKQMKMSFFLSINQLITAHKTDMFRFEVDQRVAHVHTFRAFIRPPSR